MTKVEPISAYPDKLSEQIADNRAIIEDMDKKLAMINMMKINAEELMSQSDATDESSNGMRSFICLSRSQITTMRIRIMIIII